MEDKEIYIKHIDWEGPCIFDNNKIFRKDIMSEFGRYELNDNILHIFWEKWDSEYFYLDTEKIYILIKNINIIKPSTKISLCKNKIIISRGFDEDNIDIKFKVIDNDIIDKQIYKNEGFEASYTIILVIRDTVPKLSLYINDKEIILEQLNILDHNISAMTLFKNDYKLLKRYLNYYSSLVFEIFFLYYNGKIDNALIKDINEYKVKIYLIEWDFKYWIGDKKQHYAQTMAINNSLHILKNYGYYTLYNDLDEYIIINNLKTLIENNWDIDIFVFKNRFCKMGDQLIRYEDFDNKFDLSTIVKGHLWDKYREKNLIKLQNINIIGVHSIYDEYKKYDNSIEFYHIVNFVENNRVKYLTEFIYDP